jgi:hypothetical protein
MHKSNVHLQKQNQTTTKTCAMDPVEGSPDDDNGSIDSSDYGNDGNVRECGTSTVIVATIATSTLSRLLTLPKLHVDV